MNKFDGTVYEQLWIDRNRPMEIPEYGRRAFNDTGGLSSTLLEKAASIHHYIVAVVERRLDENDQNIVRYERRYNPYTRQYEHVSIIDWDRWANDMRTIIPHSDDPDWVCQAKTLGIGVGIVGTAIMICIGKIIFRR